MTAPDQHAPEPRAPGLRAPDPPPPEARPPDPRDVLRRALLEIRALKERLAAAEAAAAVFVPVTCPVAVTGLGCRFPAADGPDAFWRLLASGGDAIGPVPAGRAGWDRWRARPGEAPPAGGFLADVEGFDARFFEIAPREAASMDPQHRLLLEVAWEALAHAGLAPSALAGSRTGVFVGLATADYARLVPEDAVDRYFGSGTSPAVAAGRIAYLLDLHGPCLTLDTACSSSLVAVHAAARALRDGDCDTALAGGVSLLLAPTLSRSFAAAGMLAADGRCRSFDAAAAGYGRGEGAGMVVLRRLADAQAAGDPVLAVLRGSAINQDGRSAGLTAPNGPAQTELIRRALAAAGLGPDDIDYIEAHGTGTPLGDPIEAHALAAAFAGRARRLAIGSVKTNIGHTEAAAGIAGLIKAVLMLGHDAIPPSLHFRRLNPAISSGAELLEVPTVLRPGVRRIGVSSFGFSGTNAHVVLEAPPPTAPRRAALAPPQFRRERFPLPGDSAASDPPRVLAPDDPLLASTDGFAHVGVLLALLGPTPPLADVVFPAPLHITAAREIRVRRASGRIALESRPLENGGGSDAAWSVHLAAAVDPRPARRKARALPWTRKGTEVPLTPFIKKSSGSKPLEPIEFLNEWGQGGHCPVVPKARAVRDAGPGQSPGLSCSLS